MNNENLGYVTIRLEEYLELRDAKMDLDRMVDDYEYQICHLSDRLDIYQREVLDAIYKDHKYDIEKLNVNEDDGSVEKEYHFFKICEKFIKMGIDSMPYIEAMIEKMYQRYLEEGEMTNE